MNILVTGGCGFIGINFVAAYLQQQKGSLCVLDNLSVGSRELLASVCTYNEKDTKCLAQRTDGKCLNPETTKHKIEGRIQKSKGPRQKLKIRGLNTGDRKHVELVVGDVRDGDLVRKVCQGMDAVVHLAANTGVIPSIENPMEDCMSNVVGTVNILEGARQNRLKRFILASSGAPVGEQNPPIHEEMVCRPISPYGASKLSGEAYCSAYYKSFGMETMVLRFGNVYGPGSTNKGSVVSKFIKQILAGEDLQIFGDGSQTRDFIYVGDLVDAILLSLEKRGIAGKIIQIATQREYAVKGVAEALNKLAVKYLGRKSKIVYIQERNGEVKRNFSDISKARRVLGFDPKICLEDGLEKTFLWFLQKGF